MKNLYLNVNFNSYLSRNILNVLSGDNLHFQNTYVETTLNFDDFLCQRNDENI